MPYEFNPFTEEFDFYLYEPTEYKAKVSASWSSLPDLPAAVYEAASTADSEGNVYVIGGDSTTTAFYVYDSQSGTWSSQTSPPSGGHGWVAVCDSNDNIHVVGGYNSTIHLIWTGSTWTSSGSLSTKRRCPAVSIDDSGNIYVSHGESDSGFESSIEKWSPTTSAFSTLSNSASHARAYLCGGYLDGKHYAVCGYNGSYCRYIEAFSVSSETWSDVTPSSGAPVARYGLYSFVSEGKMHLVYGYNGSNLRTHEVWDGSACTTVSDAPDPARRFVALSGSWVNGAGYSCGGRVSSAIKDCEKWAGECYPIEEKC